jgi:hypothetical protein
MSDWQDANRHYLRAALARIHGLLQRASGDTAAPPAAHDGELQAAAALTAPAALEQLVAIFGLSPFERDLILLCAGVEFDPAFAPLCAALHGSAQHGCATFALALACLPEPDWQALVPAAPLRHWRLIEVAPGETLIHSQLRIDERVLHYLDGTSYLDERLAALVQPFPPSNSLPPTHAAEAARLAATLTEQTNPRPLLNIWGTERGVARALAGAVAGQLGRGLFVLHAADIPALPAERQALARLWDRESAFLEAALLIEIGPGEPLAPVTALLERLHGLVMVGSELPLAGTLTRPVMGLQLPSLSRDEQQTLWQRELGTHLSRLNGHLPRLLAQFDLTGEMIRAAASEALTGPARADFDERLWASCRAQGRAALDELAARIDTRVGWDDLVLPAAQQQSLREILVHMTQRRTVYDSWGFADRGRRGLGTGVIFAGPSGTGKTLAAEVLAGELRLDLYRVDLSRVVSKYIGETEKNLRRIFQAAEYGGAVLLFDEADALFGKRSEVRDSHDRYANLEVSFLLQQMEDFGGLAILTTNMLQAFDSAFMRRVRFIVHFPFPVPEQRAEIWRRSFPAATPTERLNLEQLARLNVAGGNIRNIALNAAFLAAGAGEPVRMRHLHTATLHEYVKLGKPLAEADLRDWGETDAV